MSVQFWLWWASPKFKAGLQSALIPQSLWVSLENLLSNRQLLFFGFFSDLPCFNRKTECVWKVPLSKKLCPAARALPCAIGIAGTACQSASTVEQCAWHRHWCPAHHRDGETETSTPSDSLTEWADGRAGGGHREQIHSSAQNIRDWSDTAGAHTAPLPSIKKRKLLLQEAKKYPLNKENKERGKKQLCTSRRKGLLKLDYWHLNPIVHKDYCWPLSWAWVFLQQQFECQKFTKPQSSHRQDEPYMATQCHELEAGRDFKAPFSCPYAPELPCCLHLAAWAYIHRST